MSLIITTAPNKPKVGVSEGIQNKHGAPRRRLAYSRKQSGKENILEACLQNRRIRAISGVSRGHMTAAPVPPMRQR